MNSKSWRASKVEIFAKIIITIITIITYKIQKKFALRTTTFTLGVVLDVSWCKTILVAPVDHCLTTYLKTMVWILIMLQMLILLILQKHVRRKKASVVLEWSANSYFKKHERLVKDLESKKQHS